MEQQISMHAEKNSGTPGVLGWAAWMHRCCQIREVLTLVEKSWNERGSGSMIWWPRGDRDHLLCFAFWAHNFRIMSDSRVNLETMMNELLVAVDGLRLEPKLESPGWTSTCA